MSVITGLPSAEDESINTSILLESIVKDDRPVPGTAVTFTVETSAMVQGSIHSPLPRASFWRYPAFNASSEKFNKYELNHSADGSCFPKSDEATQH